MSIPDGTLPVDEQLRFEAFVGEKVFLYVVGRMSDFPGLQQNAKLKAIQHQAEGLVLQMTSWCVAGRIPDRVEDELVEWPDGPWQAFKAKYAPYWWLARFPVRKQSRKVQRAIHHYFVCPHLTTDSRDRHVQFMATGTRLAARMRPDGL